MPGFKPRDRHTGTRTDIKTDVESDPAIAPGTCSLGFLAHAYTTELRLKSVRDFSYSLSMSSHTIYKLHTTIQVLLSLYLLYNTATFSDKSTGELVQSDHS